MLSIPHLIVIFVVVLVVFGPEKLPELARNMGKIMAEFKRATGDLRSTFEGHMRDLEREADERKIGATAKAAAAAPAQPPPIVPAAGTVTASAPNAAAISAGAPNPDATGEVGASESAPAQTTDPGITPEPTPPSIPASGNSAQLDLMPMSPPPGDPMHDPFLFEYERQGASSNSPAPAAPAPPVAVSAAPVVPAAVEPDTAA